MKISIIVPVYKVEAYIEKCLSSLVAQDLSMDDYEIICVDDGSPDNSTEIIKKFQSAHPNIVLIAQENQGVSAARNTGLDAAKGQYVFFVDADDSIYPNVLKALYDRLRQDDLDLLYVRMEYVDGMDRYQGEFKMDIPKIEILDGFHHQRRGFIASLYRKETIGKIRFISEIPIGEDAIFNVMVHTVAKRVSYSDLPVYKYHIREDSAVNSESKYSEKVFSGYLKSLTALKAYRDDNKTRLTDDQFQYFNRPFFKTIENALKTNIIPTLHRDRLKRLKDAIRNNGLEHLNAQVAANVKYFDRHPIIFLGYYKVKKMIKNLRKR